LRARENANPHLAQEVKNNITRVGDGTQDLDTLLKATLPPVGLSQGAVPVCCLYMVDGQRFCVCQLSSSECQSLGGQSIDKCPTGLHGYNV
jgi:hypothetical protein